MKLLTAAQTREADAYTINEEGISSIDLMERAAKAFTCWFENKFQPSEQVHVFCGPGNNGGDGLAAARLLHERKYSVHVYLVGDTSNPSEDFKTNLERLPQGLEPTRVEQENSLPALNGKACVVDALFGTGLNRPVTGLYAALIRLLNESGATVSSIDMPSGLYPDSQTPEEGAIIKANYTISFELPKLAFLLPQHEEYVGEWHVVPIGLSQQFVADAKTNLYVTTQSDIQHLLKPRKKFSHKGLYGHALLLCGGYGKIGAAVLSARACLRGGIGLLTVQVPQAGYTILQTAVPEAMTLTDKNRKHLSELPKEIDKYDVIGIGPGLGTERVTKTAIGQLLATASHPMVIDADAINIIASSDKLKMQLPRNKVIFTPHPKEFERLVGKVKNDYDRLQHLREFCLEYQCYVTLKGSHTAIGTPEGKVYFNTTGNSGMATGGTGDVLTGVITALAGQQYSLEEACLLGVYLHGLAADLALHAVGEVAMTASDVIDFLPKALLHLSQPRP
ncbi:bifunctional ADP-dependent NAD(P)H-hydrate dehydratase/NAD(P)H-hydrate epimerase [Pontibacter actiniarum]|uniref:Bifunctional NAD(P)H-hydrate repair enzyme n=1 Tax=Pontibacter actiniarum TaxID=323450 RepID=A0A1X9YVS2_9BACT|nr:bifunctional ADP-dependent NAD(P)H-hydrate dehydratase/NAD(P)H-hydrate epimerase [Pontibacter actiniarum]ARS36854.1 bifunctional ADP-dependent NAD(P)H-hydrate dehydratase/NAD(P)H-hydrate epimerase [Pontibacter actiniarum]